MATLCAFSVGFLALALDRILGNDKATKLTSLWFHQGAHVIIGSILVLIAALMFYRQRSHLAWYYGQISLSLIKPNVTSRKVEYWLREADSWATWIPYRIAWGCLTLAIWTFVAAIIDAATRPKGLSTVAIWLPILLFTIIEIPHLLVLRKYRYDESPRKRALQAARKQLRALMRGQTGTAENS